LCYIGGAVADKEPKKTAASAAPRFDPKPVSVGGESLVDRVYPHRMKIGLFILSGLVIWAVIAVVVHFRDADQEASTEKLGRVLAIGQRKIREPQPEPAQGSGSAAGSNATDPKPDPKQDPKQSDNTFADAKQRANAMLEELAKHGVDAAGPSFRASLLVQAGKLDPAMEEFRKAQSALGIDGVLAREGLGLVQEMKAMAHKDAAEQHKELESALATFQAMQPDEKGPRRAFALYHQGRVLELLGKAADAKAALEKAKPLAGEGELAQLIDARLVGLGL
jgi:tetratricopeptide (TPR) repeat protein